MIPKIGIGFAQKKQHMDHHVQPVTGLKITYPPNQPFQSTPDDLPMHYPSSSQKKCLLQAIKNEDKEQRLQCFHEHLGTSFRSTGHHHHLFPDFSPQIVSSNIVPHMLKK